MAVCDCARGVGALLAVIVFTRMRANARAGGFTGRREAREGMRGRLRRVGSQEGTKENGTTEGIRGRLRRAIGSFWRRERHAELLGSDPPQAALRPSRTSRLPVNPS